MTEYDETKPPVAKCASKHCTRFLNFQRVYNVWLCGCDACLDADCDERGYYRTDPSGSGKTAWEAFESYCENADVLPDAILVTGEQHV